MKRILLYSLFLVLPFAAHADGINRYVEKNGDVLTVVKRQTDMQRNYIVSGNPTTSVPNFFVVQLENNSGTAYTALQFDLVLPHGVEAVIQEAKYYDQAQSKEVALTFGYAAKADASQCAYYTQVEANAAYDATDDHVVLSSLMPRTDDGRQVLRVLVYTPSNHALLNTTGKKDLALVFINPDSYAKAGSNEVTFSNVELSATDKTSFEMTANPEESKISDAFAVQSADNVTLSISAAEQYATIIIPFATNLPNGVKAYTTDNATPVNAKTSKLVLTEVKELEAYQPYIVFAEKGINTELSGNVDADAYKKEVTNGLLTGCIVPKSAVEGYILQHLSNTHAFCGINASQPQDIAAGQCYIKQVSTEETFELPLPDELMGVSVLNLDGNDSKQPVYDLQGRRTNGQTRGIYIVGHKKIIR